MYVNFTTDHTGAEKGWWRAGKEESGLIFFFSFLEKCSIYIFFQTVPTLTPLSTGYLSDSTPTPPLSWISKELPVFHISGLFNFFLMRETNFQSFVGICSVDFFSFDGKFTLDVFHTSNVPKIVFRWWVKYWQPLCTTLQGFCSVMHYWAWKLV